MKLYWLNPDDGTYAESTDSPAVVACFAVSALGQLMSIAGAEQWTWWGDGGAVDDPLRLFQRDDDLGKVGSARVGGHAEVGNAPSSLQRQAPPRLVQGGNVYL